MNDEKGTLYVAEFLFVVTGTRTVFRSRFREQCIKGPRAKNVSVINIDQKIVSNQEKIKTRTIKIAL